MLASEILDNIATTLPSYSVTSPPPSYSSSPSCGEQSIQLTPRCRSRPTGTYTKKSGNLTLVLTEQEENAEVPSYGRSGVVNGVLSISSRESVSKVIVHFDGQMDLVVPGGGGESTKLFEHKYTLWQYDPEHRKSETTGQCPSEIPFACVFPAKFTDVRGREQPLPPSMNLTFPGTSGFVSRCMYTLTVKVVKGRHSTMGMGIFTSVKRLSVELNHYPRTRPPNSIIENPDLFSDVKVIPEEWFQSLSVMKPRSSESVAPVHCHLFIPSVKIFALTDTIPFHVQLSGPIRSLRHLISSQEQLPKVRVYLLRQTAIEVRGEKAWRNVTLGEGKLRALPPPITMTFSDSDSDSREGSIDWEGEVCCDGKITLNSFNVGDLAVKDFIVLSVSPATTGTHQKSRPSSEFQLHQVPVNIRLVTDSALTWSDD